MAKRFFKSYLERNETKPPAFSNSLHATSHLLQVGEVEELAELLLELRLGHRLVVEQLDSVLLHLEAKQVSGRRSGMQ